MKRGAPKYSLGICIPVWNRGDLFQIAFEALLKQLKGINASIWIFDNGSDKQTVDIVQQVRGNETVKVVKTFFSENMGIPYVTNVFAKAIMEECDYTGYKRPGYILLMDADAYFQRPVAELIGIFEKDYSVGLVSGHDSIEHPAVRELQMHLGDTEIVVKEKENERMISMLMRVEEFQMSYPFSHHRNRDVDWEITQWGVNAMKKRSRRIFVACDYVLHLGIKTSTWNESQDLLATPEEIEAVEKILNDHRNNNSTTPRQTEQAVKLDQD